MSYITDGFDDRVVELIEQGAVGLLPTDTIYGLSARALDQAAVEWIHQLKGRDGGKPLIVLISDLKMLDLLSISQNQAGLIHNYWPGALSAIFESAAPDYLTRGTHSLAVRWPDHPALVQLINKVGPVVSTSANLQGQPPAKSVAEVQAIFGDQLDFYVNAEPLDNPPSTLVSVKNGQLVVERPGAVKID